MKLQREDIHPLQDTCPYLLSIYFRRYGNLNPGRYPPPSP